jgi:chromate transporter
MPISSQQDHPRPQSLTDLFTSFSILALQGFGGVLAVVQRELVERKRWLTQEEFVEDWAVAQLMPGPNVVNMSLMIGARHFGVPGALAALAGMLTAPLIILLLLALVYTHYASHPMMIGALRGMSAVAAGLITASGIKLMGALKNNPMGRFACAALGLSCFVAIALLRVPLAYVLLVVGGIGCIYTYRKIAP